MATGKTQRQHRWDEEIDDLVSGRMNSALRLLGSVRDTFDAALASTANPGAETRAFHAALFETVRRWTPQPWARPRPTALMLDLISVYKPVGGYEKTVGLIEHYGQREHVIPHPLDSERTIDLHLRALYVLASYFRYAPHSISPGFEQYVTVLQNHLDHERYRAHAVSRLLQLHVVRLEHVKVGAILDDHPVALGELIAAALRLEPKSVAERAISQLYAQCKMRPLLDDFAAIITTMGGKVWLGEGAYVEFDERRLMLQFEQKQEAEAYKLVPGFFRAEIENRRQQPRPDRGHLRAVGVDEASE